MTVVATIAELRAAIGREALAGRSRIGFVPTMGALHEGHATLIRAARGDCDLVVVSVFVNPSQFNDPSDLAAYPRRLERDVEAAGRAGAAIVFAPPDHEMYPQGFSTWIEPAGPASGFESDFRPGHFRGVATVCAKLFGIVRPAFAYFGQKDAQQVAVIRQLVRDLNLDLAIRVVPTLRDPDGLAMSSRNARLSAAERERALSIPRALAAGVKAYATSGDPGAARAAARSVLAASGLDMEYCDVVRFDSDTTLVIAARSGGTRLIDNVPLDDPARAGLGPGAPANTEVRHA